jgi:hypothetical protein
MFKPTHQVGRVLVSFTSATTSCALHLWTAMRVSLQYTVTTVATHCTKPPAICRYVGVEELLLRRLLLHRAFSLCAQLRITTPRLGPAIYTTQCVLKGLIKIFSTVIQPRPREHYATNPQTDCKVEYPHSILQ